MRRLSPTVYGVIYSVMGILFLYVAAESTMMNGLWTFPTIAFLAIATFDIGTAIRLFFTAYVIKQAKKKK
ncbi:DUF4305 domain-containing protein [Aureibacillus halotolerans]|uniref:Uncharacterized protein DUF4305 n=1 Tax=Aureibacillus halotolerans TaxID=1508390 RepID=A0A4R6TQL3_9BACI|nr:DUF4305 domain-containing protein [Aureibacillus halotolerans]TDQ35229.1 uncharacterized protein DUF4305 [Aureibacillus halotolerans]